MKIVSNSYPTNVEGAEVIFTLTELDFVQETLKTVFNQILMVFVFDVASVSNL